MPTPQWNDAPGLIGALLAEPHRFEFFQAVRLIALARRERGGDDGDAEGVCFRNRLSLGFPPSEIDSVAGDDQGMRVTPAFMGLLGGQGSLPLHYSERINRHEKSSGDGGPRAFVDLLSHRALALFHQAWATHRPECLDEDDGFLRMLCALSGAQAGGDAIVEAQTLAFHAMRLRSRAVSAPLLAGMCAQYFEAPFAVEQLVGQWQALPADDQARLGVAHVDLGAGVLLGERIYRCDARARLRIGPLGGDAYERFLPGHDGAARLRALLALHCGAGMSYEVYLIEGARDVRGFSLDEAGGARLGVDACLYTRAPVRDREDLMYVLWT